MGGIVKAVSSVVSSIFGGGSSPAPTPAPALVAPTVANSGDALDAAAQKQAAQMQGGRTSTLLTGGTGETEDQKYTSKVLLGQ